MSDSVTGVLRYKKGNVVFMAKEGGYLRLYPSNCKNVTCDIGLLAGGVIAKTPSLSIMPNTTT